MKSISILNPDIEGIEYKELSEVTCHDLALDLICQKVSDKEAEQRMILKIISKMTADERVARYRSEVFKDITSYPQMRSKMLELLDKVQFIKDFGSFKTDYDKKAGIWNLLHRLEEINDYISCVEAIRECLSEVDIKSEGLKNLKAYVDEIYEEAAFGQLKKDIQELKADTSSLKSITLGINVNERFEVSGVGVVSVNNKPFKNSNIVSNFANAIDSKNGVKEGCDWNGDMHFYPLENNNGASIKRLEKMAGFNALSKTPFVDSTTRSTIVSMADKDANADVTNYMDKAFDSLLGTTIKKLRDVLSRYVHITIVTMTNLIPEFVYYIKFAEFIEKMQNAGMNLCEATPCAGDDCLMNARGIYNMKLAVAELSSSEIVSNDILFDRSHLVYILTGANRGGKTTITQAVGQMFVLAQGGIFVPGTEFNYAPVDCIYTHFPADEDKTMDLGRLGEECTRFKEMYTSATDKSLLLMNETFSTTSFEEGYYIARDSVKAILAKGVRTIYNTHMHKLAFDIKQMNESSENCKAASLVVKSEGGSRSFKVEIAEPTGMSYAEDIARKYGVTYEMLVNNGVEN